MSIDFNSLTTDVVVPEKDSKDNGNIGIDFSDVKSAIPSRDKDMGIVASEEDGGTKNTFGITRAPYSSSTSVEGLHDPLDQTVVGLVKGGNISRRMLDVDSPAEFLYNVYQDPGRLADIPRPYVNFALAGAEWVSNKVSETMANVSDYVDHDEIKLPRFDYEVGDYPEREQPRNKAKEKNIADSEQWVRDYEAEFLKQKGSMPYITEALSFAPDILTVFGGGATLPKNVMNRHKALNARETLNTSIRGVSDTPVAAGTIESGLAGARAEGEGKPSEEVGAAKAFGMLGGVYGAKAADFLFNNLTRKEMDVISKISADPKMKEDAIALLEYYRDNKGVNSQLIFEGKTGNKVIDDIVSRQQDQMGSDAYDLYSKTLTDMGDKASQTLSQVTQEFSEGSQKLYDEMSGLETKNWNAFTDKLDITETIDTANLSKSLDDVLFDSPDVIKNFSKKLLKSDTNDFALQDIQKRKDALAGDFAIREKLVDNPKDLKTLKAHTKTQLDELDAETAILKGNAAEAAQNLSAVDLIEMIKKINNKKFLKGSAVNTGDKSQGVALSKLKAELEKQLEAIPGFDALDPLYQQAKQTSTDKFSTFGYKGGKNAGADVFNPELGTVLAEQTPKQMEIIQDMMETSPDIFNTKMKGLSENFSPEQVDKLRKHYVEQRLNKGVINPQLNPQDAPTINANSFDTAVAPFLDTENGRALIKDSFGDKGEVILKQLSQVRAITAKLKAMEEVGQIEPSKLKSYLSQLPKTIKTILFSDISDAMFTKRMLKGYGEAAGDLGDLSDQTLAGHLLGTAGGAIVAPEGEELTGAVAGGMFGKYGGRMNFIKNTKVGKKTLSQIQQFLKRKE